MKTLRGVSQVMAMVGTALVLPMMVLIIADVVLRFAFSQPITGTAEIASLMLVCMVLGISWCAIQGRHISVSLLMERVSLRAQAIVDSITMLAGLVICIIITWRSFLSSLWVQRYHEIASELLPLPVFPFHWIFFLGWVALCLVMVPLIIQKVKGAVQR